MASQLETVPTSSGHRVFTPSHIPGRDDLDGELWPLEHDAFIADWSEYQTAQDRKAKAKSERKSAEENYIREAAQAKSDGRTLKDPRPAKVKADEAADVDLQVAEQVLADRTEHLDRFRRENAVHLAAVVAERRELIGERKLRLLEELSDAFVAFSATRHASAWLAEEQPPGAVGSKHLNALEKDIRDIITPPRFVYVRQPEMRKLKAGNDAVDVEGNAVPFEETDAQVRAGRVKVQEVHGPLSERPVYGLGGVENA